MEEKFLKRKKERNKFTFLTDKLDTPDKVHSYYRKIISNMPNNVYWLDRNCITQGCNNNILKLVGLKNIEDFIGIDYKKMGELAGWTEGQAQAFEQDDREVMSTGIPKFNVEDPPVYDENGNARYYISSRVPILDDKAEEVIGIVGISVDITERKKQEKILKVAKEKAEVANQAKTEFLENMRHDIRTPLSGIVGCAHLIQSKSTNPIITQYANDLVESSDALLEFLNKILESITVASGEIPLLKKKFDLYLVLDQVIRLNQSQASARKLVLNLVYDQSIPAYLIGDSVRIQRIILELVTNALKFTEKGQVKVSGQLMKREARQLVIKLSVSDTGIGIPMDKQTDIYTRFKCLSPSYRGVYPGTGLGLSVVKQFLDDLEAEIYLESNLQKGSVFSCLIPFQEPLLSEDESGSTKEIPAYFEPRMATSENTFDSINMSTAKSPNIIGSRILIVEDNR